MHLDFFAEGWDRDLDFFEKWISTRLVSINVKNPDGTERTEYTSLALRPRRAYSLVFPKEFLDPVLNTLKPTDCNVSLVDGKGTRILQTPLKIIRKLLRLKPIPKPDEKNGYFPHPIDLLKNIRIIGLGIREDQNIIYPDKTKHEGL